MPETLVEKVTRHLRTGQVDPGTVARGFQQSFGYFFSRNEAQGQLVQETFQEDALRALGIVVTKYYYRVPQLPPALNRLLPRDGFTDGLERKLSPAIYTVEFPLGSRFNVHLDSTPDRMLLHTAEYFKKYCPDATFTGPTFEYDKNDHLPNNGFYLKGSSSGTDFRDTNPSGLRKGAFAVFPSRRLSVLDDQHKWALVRSGYPGIQALVGTSYYFTQDTELPNIEYNGKMQASYLVQYRKSPEDEARTCFVLSTGMITRNTMKAVIDDYVTRRGGLGYIAVEMEMAGAACMIKRGDGTTREFGAKGFNRRDHYGVFFPKDGSTVVPPDPLQPVLDEFWAGILGRKFRPSRVTIPVDLDPDRKNKIIPKLSQTIHDYGQWGIFNINDFSIIKELKLKSSV